MKKTLFIITLLFLNIQLFSQNSISGVLVDSLNNERLPYVNV